VIYNKFLDDFHAYVGGANINPSEARGFWPACPREDESRRARACVSAVATAL